jgi:hypothetical protein
MKKGYWFIILFSLFVSLIQVFKTDVFLSDSIDNQTYNRIFIRATMLFLTLFIPGVFVVRWYYKVNK